MTPKILSAHGPSLCSRGNGLTLTQYYEKVKDLLTAEEFESKASAKIREWAGLLDEDAAALLVLDELGRFEATFARLSEMQEGQEVSLRLEVTGVGPLRHFTRPDGTDGRVVNLEVSDPSGRGKVVLWDDDTELIERGKIGVGTRLRAIDCFVKRTDFGLEVTRGRFGSFLPEETRNGSKKQAMLKAESESP